MIGHLELPTPGSVWLHQKAGTTYRVLGFTRIESTQEIHVLYVEVEADEDAIPWSRPLHEWVGFDGDARKRRFQMLTENMRCDEAACTLPFMHTGSHKDKDGTPFGVGLPPPPTPRPGPPRTPPCPGVYVDDVGIPRGCRLPYKHEGPHSPRPEPTNVREATRDGRRAMERGEDF